MKVVDRMKRGISFLTAAVMIAAAVPVSAFARPGGTEEGKYISRGISESGNTYYVDSAEGDDSNNGKSHKSAWRTLDQVTDTEFMPGDHILLKAGSIWNGQMLYPKGSGSRGQPIVIDLYDVKGGQAVYSSDIRPVINGNGTKGIGIKETIISGAVMLYNQEFWEVHNLEVTNSEDLSDPDAYKKSGSTQRAGILAYSDNQDIIYEHIVIKDCYVHDVQSEHFQRPKDSSVKGLKAVGGIIILGHHLDPDGVIVARERGKSTAGYKDVRIEGNMIQRVGLEGIRTKCNSDTSLSGNTFFKTFSDIVIRNNYLEDIAGDGIVLTEVSEGGIVENNIAKQPCNADYGTQNYAGIWSMYADNALFQYNEVYGIKYGYNDGEAYDIDMACNHNTYQYNYSHHNGGGFMLFMANQYDSVVRYNISANDGGGNRGYGAQGGDGIGGPYTYQEQSVFHYWNKTDNSTMPTIYNNTIYIGDGVSTALYGEGNTSSDNTGTRARFYNNIICKEGEGSFRFLTGYPDSGADPVERSLGEGAEKYFKNNIIWPESILSERSGMTREVLEQSGNIFENPLLAIQQEENRVLLEEQNNTSFDPEEDDIYQYTSADALRGRASLFQLQSGSPAVGNGMPVEGELEGGDFFGNSLENSLPDIGAHQISNIPYTTEIGEIEDILISTTAGFYPALPKKVRVKLKITTGEEITYRDEVLDAVWEMIPMEALKMSGEIVVEGVLKGFDKAVYATVMVKGSVGSGFETWTEAAGKDAYIQRDTAGGGTTAYGAVEGRVLTTADYIKKYPLERSFSNNYVLKIKNAASSGYNRRFLIGFDIRGFEAELNEVSQASIRLHIARYDSWNGAGGSEPESQLNNTRCILDVYALDSDWEEETVTWNSLPENQELTQYNHNGGGASDNRVPDYEEMAPVAHKLYINRDIIANDHTIDIDITDYIIGLGESGGERSEISFLVDIPYSPDYNKDNSGFDAFSKEGAKAAYDAYEEGNLPSHITVEAEDSLAPQIVFSSVSEEGIEPIEVETKAGSAPELPQEAMLVYSDGTVRRIGVEWDPILAADYRNEGEFLVYGSSAVTNIPVIARVTVVADHIVGIKALPVIHTFTGKSRNELGLAAQCVAVLDSGESMVILIDSWNDSDRPYSPGMSSNTYNFTASLLLPDGITNPDELEVSQKVITHPVPLDIEFLSAPETVVAGNRAGFEVMVLLSEETEDAWSSRVTFYLLDSEGTPVTEGMEIDGAGMLTTYPNAVPGSYQVYVKSRVADAVYAERTFLLKEMDEPDLIIDRVQEFPPVYAPIGLEADRLPLPAEAEITLEGGQTLKRNIRNWTSDPPYQPGREGEYLFTGEIDVSSHPHLQNPRGLKVHVAVILEETVSEGDKEELKEVLNEAFLHIENGTVDQLIPSVKEKFLEAYRQAELVWEDENAVRGQVENAKKALMEVLQLLEYKQADKTELKMWLETAESIGDLSIYTEASADALRQALSKAKRLMGDEELTGAEQAEVDEAVKALKKAVGGMELPEEKRRPQKGSLPGVVKEAAESQKPYYPSGIGDSSGWRVDKNGWWLETGYGTYTKSEWKQIDGRWFFFDPTGYMAVGWRRLTQNNWYYLKSDGVMAAGWFNIDGFWYYFNPDGVMRYGWVEWKGNWYYMNEKGAMLTEAKTPDGYDVNQKGVWVR